jgi:hypothetical protein
MNKKNISQTIKKLELGATLLVGLTGQTLANDCSLNVSSSVKSVDVRKIGVLGDTTTNQNIAALTCGNLTGVLWSNKDIESGKTTENDFIIRYGFELNDSIKGRVGFDRWNFPQAGLGVDVFEAGVHHSGFLETDVTYTHNLSGGGSMVHGSLQKNLNLGSKLNTSIGVSVAYVDDFFGTTGVTQVTPKINLSYNLTDKLSVNGSINKQFGFENQENKTYASLGLNYQF